MHANKRGKLIVLEGIDGTGKSTQTQLLTDALNAVGHKALRSFEPTKGPIGTKLRESATTGRLSAEEELELFLADRKEHVRTLITPSLEAGTHIVLDRYYFSTMAYQGARGFNPQEIRQKNESFAPKPDLLLIVDIPVDLALDRIDVRDGEGNEFEKRESLVRCQQIFLSLAEEPFARVIDGNQSIEEIHQNILKEVFAIL